MFHTFLFVYTIMDDPKINYNIVLDENIYEAIKKIHKEQNIFMFGYDPEQFTHDTDIEIIYDPETKQYKFSKSQWELYNQYVLMNLFTELPGKDAKIFKIIDSSTIIELNIKDIDMYLNDIKSIFGTTN